MQRTQANLLLIALAMLLLSASLARAATRTVTNANDSGAGSLRANIAAAAAGDTIAFAAGLTGPIVLSSGELGIAKNLTIKGPVYGLTVTANQAVDRVFNISSGAIVALSNLTVTGGAIYPDPGDGDGYDGFPGNDAQGGGILNNGTLTLRNCTISGNEAVGGDGGDSAVVTIGCNGIYGLAVGTGGKGGAAQGGGIFNGGTLTLIGCTVSGNSVRGGRTGTSFRPIAGGDGDGGGIFNQGKLTLSNCTFSGNGAVGGAANSTYGYGAIGSRGGNGDGGGLFSQGTLAVTLTNCAFSANAATGGKGVNAYDRGGNGGNGTGGGVFVASGSAKPTVRNTIVAKNTVAGGVGGVSTYPGTNNPGAPGTASAPDVAGAVTSTGHNLIGDGTGSSGFIGSGDQVGVADPGLGPLQNNGGLTQTMALLPGSPALDKGSTGTSIDQRGVPRPQDNPAIPNAANGSDIGAYERDVTAQTGPNFIVTTIDEHSDGFCGDDCSLWDAANAANENAEASTIKFKAGLSGTITTTLQPSGIHLSAPVTITGPGASVITVSGAGTSRVFNVTSSVVVISDLTIANGKAGDAAYPANAGGGLFNDHGNVTLRNCILSNNHASFGGALLNYGDGGSAMLTLNQCSLVQNSAELSGGGILSDGEHSGNATLSLNQCTLDQNTASYGAGIFSDGDNGGHATLNISNSTFAANTASELGGGIYNDGRASGSATTRLSSCTFNLNAAAGNSSASVYNNAVQSGLTTGTATLEIGNTILRVGAGQTNIVSDSVVTSRGYNLSSDNGSGFLTGTGDKINTNPLLDPAGLKDNGGPTPTVSLQSGSPALDKGKRNTIPILATTTDQRGKPRPVDAPGIASATGGDGSDIGAVEVQPPFLTINNVSQVEGDSSTSLLVFTVTLSPASSQTVTVNYATANSTATAGSDYVTKSGTLTFAAGVTTQPVSITINGDTAVETNEIFRLNLSAAANAFIADSQGNGTITNDDS